ncbi:unnamed protein product [Adineta ricciae]|uniref:6-bladed beta-propeller n=1 Tax=Adineta ricciae TaxID=249248 RepID=A0A815V8Z3_ADIRI|nr:unnamed protein product [Adineta ricciae]
MGNHRIMKWKPNTNEGEIVAGEYEHGNKIGQLNLPTDVVIDEENNSLIITDKHNRRVVRWFNGTQQEILIENISCPSIAIDKYGYIYASDLEKGEVRRWKIGENEKETIVAGGNGPGNQLNQLDAPYFIFVDDEQSIYVSDHANHFVMKWLKDAKEGIIIAGGNGKGAKLNQLNRPEGLFVDDFGQIYVVDRENHRIMRWNQERKEGEIVVGENGQGLGPNQLSNPMDLSFDIEGNLYVSEWDNHRIQKFDLIFE